MRRSRGRVVAVVVVVLVLAIAFEEVAELAVFVPLLPPVAMADAGTNLQE